MKENAIQTLNKSKVFFEVVKGSNYKVTQINKKESIIEYEQFQKLATVLNNSEVLFVTINKKLVNKNRIDDIEPTKELTEKQKIAKEQEKEEKEKTEQRKKELEKLKRDFDVEFFNKEYGAGQWTMYPNPFKKKLKVVEPKIRQLAWAEFKKQYPIEAKEIEKILD